MSNVIPKIDFDTMRVNCIQIHQEVVDLLKVAKRIGEPIDIKVNEADELKINPDTKTWDGMGRYAKWLYDQTELWDRMPVQLTIQTCDSLTKVWSKGKALAELLNCYQELGGKNLDIL